MYQQLWGYKVEEKLYLGVREQKRLNTTAIEYTYLYRLLVSAPTKVYRQVVCLCQNFVRTKGALM
jgi:hypothetical protein